MADTANNSETAFAKALAFENDGNNAMAERFLQLAVKRDIAERGLDIK